MEPLEHPDLDEETIQNAISGEAAYDRIWLPPEPWWNLLVEDAAKYASSIHRKMVRGHTFPRADVVDVRKPGHGTRPVSIGAPDARVAYRALADLVVSENSRTPRSAEAYGEFVLSPIRAAFESGTLWWLGASAYSHVLLADVAAYYQYIDHALLLEELDLVGADNALVDGLIQVLGDMEGRSFGIPQRSEPSDWLGDLYASRLERWLAREGFDVWRYSDDFRIGCANYPDVLRALEALGRAAREVGLVLNDQKTVAPTFLTYLSNNSTLEVHDPTAEVDPSDVEAAISDEYSDDAEETLATAIETISRLWDPYQPEIGQGDDQWSIVELSAEQHRAVRRAINTLTVQADGTAVPWLLSLMAYQPAMTHRIVRYLEAVAEMSDEVESVFSEVISRLSLNNWQKSWIAYGVRSCGLELNQGSPIVQWLENEAARRHGSLAAAEAALTLASLGGISAHALQRLLRFAGESYKPWYLYGIRLLAEAGDASENMISALKQSGALESAILTPS